MQADSINSSIYVSESGISLYIAHRLSIVLSTMDQGPFTIAGMRPTKVEMLESGRGNDARVAMLPEEQQE